MSEQSYIFDFTRIDSFFEQLNINFKIAEMNGATDKFSFVLSSYSYDNIEDCIDANGVLKSEVITDNTLVVDAPLTWSNNTDGTCDISLTDNVVWDIGEENVVSVKALFLIDYVGSHVMGYCINQNPIEVTNQLIFPSGTILWTVSDGGYHG